MIAIQCRWMFSLAGGVPRATPGLLTLAQWDGGWRVVAVGRNESTGSPHDLGDFAILPPLTNAHCHLEFSDLTEPLGEPGMSLPAWIKEVVRHRRAADTEGQRRASYLAGLAESRRAGVATVGDITTLPWSPDWISRQDASACPGVAMLELLSLDVARVDDLIQTASRHLSNATPWRAGLSPHAPYSTTPELVDRACQLCRETGAPLAMHLAESREELELLASGGGAFRELLESFGVWRERVFDQPRGSIDVLQQLARAPCTLVVHGNYLGHGEIELLSQHRDRMTVVYCPRTHAFFRHDEHPLPSLLAAGVPVALGTDSRASNPDLSVWNELRCAAERHPSVSPAELFRMVTTTPALALGFAPMDLLGCPIESLVAAPIGAGGDPWESLVEIPNVAPLLHFWQPPDSRGEL
ncbi:MAG: amidohydrolase family protein [Planctomycetales bacterium]|nr:amidohydrolase family protein [Planctomycetales bacterium]